MSNITWSQLTPGQQEYLTMLALVGEWVNMSKGQAHYYDSVVLCDLGLAEANEDETQDRITPAGLAVWQQRDGAVPLTALWQPASDDTQPDMGAALDDFRAAVAALELSVNFDTDGGVAMTECAVDVFQAGVAMLRARGVTQGAFGDAMTRRLMHTANG